MQTAQEQWLVPERKCEVGRRDSKETDDVEDGGNHSVTVGVRGLAATRGDAPIFSPGVSQTNNPV